MVRCARLAPKSLAKARGLASPVRSHDRGDFQGERDADRIGTEGAEAGEGDAFDLHEKGNSPGG